MRPGDADSSATDVPFLRIVSAGDGWAEARTVGFSCDADVPNGLVDGRELEAPLMFRVHGNVVVPMEPATWGRIKTVDR